MKSKNNTNNFIIIHPTTGAKFATFIREDGMPCFWAKEACDSLAHSNSRKALESLDEDLKGITQRYTRGGNQDAAYLTEQGLYELMAKSRLPAAKILRKWFFGTVLPEIARTGGFLPGTTELEKIQAGKRMIKIREAKLHGEHTAYLVESGRLPIAVFRVEYGIAAIDALDFSREVRRQAKLYGERPVKLYLKPTVNAWPRFILIAALQNYIPRLPYTP
ncbi:MAG: BRO family protein [Verrucomicrobiota bacterium]